jgi:hypothetical protein
VVPVLRWGLRRPPAVVIDGGALQDLSVRLCAG